MQLFGRCGGLGIVTIDASDRDTFLGLKQDLCRRHPELGTPSELSVFYRGRQWRDGCTMCRARVGEGATLDFQGRLRGGGGDGGSTGAESRDCYLEMYKGKKRDKVNPAEEKLAKWTTCHLSGEPLSPPCCADELGNLYNKDAVVRALVSKTVPKFLPHITGLKALTAVKLEPNPHAKSGRGAARTAADFQPSNEAEWVCPVSGLEMNGRFRFVLLRPSGVVVSEKALKEAKAAVLEVVGAEWGPDDVLVLNPEGEELDRARERVLVKLATTKAKKDKRKLKATTADAAVATDSPLANGSTAAAVNGHGGVSNGGVSNGGANGTANGALDAGLAAKVKRARGEAGDGKDSAVYRSIFLDPSKRAKETYCCRSTSARGMNLT